MNLMTLITQIILTIPLTIILNYVQNKNTNRVNQIIIPTLYIIIIAALFPALKENIFLIVPFELFIRNFYITSVVNQRQTISNARFIIESIISIAISLFTYNYFIKNVDSVIPNPEDIKPFLWFLIIIYFTYIYSTITKEKVSTKKTTSINLKNEQIIMQYAKFKNKYSSIIKSKNNVINILTYATMIYNDYKTPKLYRNIKSYLGAVTKTETPYGIMQIKSYQHLTDEESITKVINDYEENMKTITPKDPEQLNKLLHTYQQDVQEEIINIYNVIFEFIKK